MLEKYSERARNIVKNAQEEAEKRQNDYIGTEHILLVLLKDADGLPAKLLNKMGILVDELVVEIERKSPRNQDVLKFARLPFTPFAKVVLDLAVEEASFLGNNYVEGEHLLLGLIREEKGLAGEILRSLGANLEKARELTAVSRRHKSTGE